MVKGSIREARAGGSTREDRVKTQDALNLLIALEERVARIYLRFFRTFRDDGEVGRTWWDMARDEYGHVGILKMVRDLVPPEAESGEIGSRLWTLVERVERCEHEAEAAQSLGRAVELAIQLETSELDVLGHRIVESLRTELPEGVARPFVETDSQSQRLVAAVERVPDARLRLRLETMLGSAKGR
jgi:rubrerythrin